MASPAFPRVGDARSANMRAIKSKDTAPEMIVRRMVHGLGFRYRLHRKDLPGKPDLVFAGRRKVVFVNGCFWHGHDCRRGFRKPGENTDYWIGKIRRNVERDALNAYALEAAGWQLLTIWECETKAGNRAVLQARISAFLESA